MKTSIIQLDSFEDTISIREKISWSKTNRILLVWPIKGLHLQKIDLVLILRACQQKGTQLALVTDLEEVTNIARELGIPVYSSLRRAQRVPWRRPKIRKLSTPERSSITISRKNEFSQVKVTRSNRTIRYGSLAVSLLAVIALVLTFLPAADIQVFPLRESQELIVELRPDSKTSVINLGGGIPVVVRQVEVEGEDSIQATGTVTVAARSATGSVVFTNLTKDVVQIPPGLVLASTRNPSIRFQIIESTQLAGSINAKAEARIQAINPGTLGNVASGDVQAIEGVLGTKVSVNNPVATSGGLDQVEPAPTAQDYEKLKNKLLERLIKSAISELKRDPLDGYLLEKSFKLQRVLQESASADTNSPSETLRISMRVAYQAWMVEKDDLQALAKLTLDASLPEGTLGLPDTLQVLPMEEKLVESESPLRWLVKLTREMEKQVDTTAISTIVRARSPGEAMKILEKSGEFRNSPKIELMPPWWPLLPVLSFRISVVTP